MSLFRRTCRRQCSEWAASGESGNRGIEGLFYTTSTEQAALDAAGREAYAGALNAARYGPITTEIKPLGRFYYVEDYHQQYFDKNPRGYCNLHGTGIACSITGTSGLGVSAPQ
jgi:peptide-methionine (S)-S-oxide reductase